MQSFVVAAAVHQTSGEFIDDDDLSVLDHIVDLVFHAAVCLDRLIDMVLDRDVIGIGEVFDIEELLRLFHAHLGEGGGIGFFIDDIVDAVLLIKALEILLRVDLSEYVLFHGAGKLIRALIQVGRLIALAGYDQRGTRLIDEDGVDLVHDRKVMLALNLVFLVDDHVIAQVVKAQFIVGAVGDVGGVGFSALIVFVIVDDQTDREPQKPVELAHPLGVALCQIVVDGDDMHALAGQTVEVGGQGRDQRFTFAGLHLGDTPLMQNDAADDLYGEVLHSQHAPACFTADGKCVGQDIVGGLAAIQPAFEDICLRFQLGAGHLFVLAFQRKHLVTDGTDPFKLFCGIISEECFE